MRPYRDYHSFGFGLKVEWTDRIADGVTKYFNFLRLSWKFGRYGNTHDLKFFKRGVDKVAYRERMKKLVEQEKQASKELNEHFMSPEGQAFFKNLVKSIAKVDHRKSTAG